MQQDLSRIILDNLFHFQSYTYIRRSPASLDTHLTLVNLANRPILRKVDVQPISLRSAFVMEQWIGRAHLFSWKSMVTDCPSGMILVFSGRSDIAKVCEEGQL